MDIQTVLVFILALLTVNLIIVGVYVVLVLKELRETIHKANNILETADSVTSIVSNPLSMITTLVGAVTEGYRAVQDARTSIRSLRD